MSNIVWLNGCLLLCVMSTAVGKQPFVELTDLFEHQEFMYDQVLSPPPLRKFFIPLSLIEYGAYGSVSWCDRIEELLDSMSIPSSLHYVAPAYASGTYAEIKAMVWKVSLEMPLIFLADKNHYHSARAVESVLLGGGFYALIFNHALLARRTAEQLRALVARELGLIARLVEQKKHRIRNFFLTGVGVGLIGLALQHGSVEWVKERAATACVLAGMVGGGLVVSMLGDFWLNKINDKEVKNIAVSSFGSDIQEYEWHLKSIEEEERARARQREFYAYGYIFVLIKRIDALTELVAPYVTYFLKNQLMTFSQTKIQKPAYLKAGFFDAE